MEREIDGLIDAYERGKLTRRDLAAGLSAVALALSGSGAASAEDDDGAPTFQADGLHHIALRVTDVDRSTDFYRRHLGLTSLGGSSSPRFLRCGPDFVALFRGSRPGLDHYSYSIPGYSQRRAAEALRGAGLEPLLEGGRTYFLDPDGIKVQVS